MSQKVWKGLFLYQQSSQLNQAQDIQLLQTRDGLNVSVTHLLRGQSDTETAPDARSKKEKKEKIN